MDRQGRQMDRQEDRWDRYDRYGSTSLSGGGGGGWYKKSYLKMLMMFTMMVRAMGVSPTAQPIRCKFRYIARNTRLCRISTVLNVKVFLSLLLPQSQAIVVITMPVILFFVWIFYVAGWLSRRKKLSQLYPPAAPMCPPLVAIEVLPSKVPNTGKKFILFFLLKPRFTLTGRPGQARQHPVGLPWLKPNH